MKVGIDVTTLGGESISGVGFHIIRLLEAIERLIDSSTQVVLFYESSSKEQDARVMERLGHLKKMTFVKVPFIKTKLGKLHSFKSKYWFPWHVAKQKCDVFHGPSHSFPKGIKVPTLVTMHDLAVFRHDLYDESFNVALRNAMSSSVESADIVISLSEYTKQEIKEITGRSEGVHVVYGAGNYCDDDTRKVGSGDEKRLSELGINGSYVFYVGDFGVRKNIPYLIESYKALVELDGTSDVQLVLAGNSAPVKEQLQEQITALGLRENSVILPGRVNDEDLKILYRNAKVFVLASLGEGFTLVTLEAMSYGIPVVATDTTSITEGTGDAAILVPTDNAQVCANALHKALTDEQKRQEMIESGLQRYKLFTWEANAQKTLGLYQLAAKG